MEGIEGGGPCMEVLNYRGWEVMNYRGWGSTGGARL